MNNKSRIKLIKMLQYFLMLAIIFITPYIGIADMEQKHDMERQMTHEPSVAPKTISEDMTCPVCNMYPTRYPTWHTQVIFRDGSFVVFDGCRDMFKFLLNMAEYDKSHTMDDVAIAYVKDFNTGEWLNAKDAHYVVGSDVLGPMGKEVISFKDYTLAMSFLKRHGGNYAHYAEITMELLNSLGGKMKIEEGGHKMEIKEGMEIKKEMKMEHKEEMEHKH